MYDLIVVGGGAAGVFAALSAKAARPEARVALLEKSAVLLAKVRVSGGGRCNVTHACFDPALLVRNYPRGSKELLGPFHRFQPRDTIAWFESRGASLKTEADGRIFPITDKSQTIIDTLLLEAKQLGVEIYQRAQIQEIKKEEGSFVIEMKEGQPYLCLRLLLATGSSPDGFAWAEKLGHTIQKPVPSLFTFNVPTSPLKELSGIALPQVGLTLAGSPFSQEGALLITHFGFSGPAAIKLSAWAARFLHERGYQAELLIDWLPQWSEEAIFEKLSGLKTKAPQKLLLFDNLFALPKNLWKALLGDLGEQRLGEVSIKELRLFAHKLHADTYLVEGKTTNKEEFVTCGGVTLKEVDFKSMQSKILSGLFFAGEILDIDGVTGGFNFQSAWTTGFIGGSHSI
jgi:predicted Rossmann fold flavoprotein